MEGIKNLIIDFGGVIINLTRNRCVEAFENFGVPDVRDRILNSKDLMLDDVPAYKLDLLMELRSKYNTMLLSNTNEIHWLWAEKNSFAHNGHQAGDFFNKIYLSYELNMVKPNADIFEYVLQDAAIDPAETLFIDDAIPNCRTAEALGIRTYAPQPREDWSPLFR